MRYAGQNYELDVALPEAELDDGGLDELLRRFEREHDARYGFALPGEVVEIIHLKVSALRPEQPPALAAPVGVAGTATSRAVWFDAGGPTECPIVRREQLTAGDELEGPLVIEEVDSTTLVPPGDTLRVHPSGVLVLTLGALA
jgi:N-methylhydantoinase A